MTPDQEPVRVLSPDELAEALKQRVTRPCPLCHGTVWDVPNLVTLLPTLDDPNGPTKITAKDEGSFSIQGIFALPIICQTCGFIAQFEYDALSKGTQH
jgi:hypothetical protein